MEHEYYGVMQSDCGHEYRWVFEVHALSRAIYDNGDVPESDVVDCGFPLTGSNCSATSIRCLRSDKEVRTFLTELPDGPDADDPMLIDIGEYVRTIADDDEETGACTREVMDRLGIDYEHVAYSDDKHHHREGVIAALALMISADYEDFDYGDPYHGENSRMRYSELLDLADEVGGHSC